MAFSSTMARSMSAVCAGVRGMGGAMRGFFAWAVNGERASSSTLKQVRREIMVGQMLVMGSNLRLLRECGRLLWRVEENVDGVFPQSLKSFRDTKLGTVHPF